jgi:hypothetical protein
MKSFNQFCYEAVNVIEMSDFSAGGGNAKMRETGMTRDQVIALGQKNLARLKNKPSPAKKAVASTRPAPKKDERPTVAQVASAKKAAETQQYRDTASFSASLGGVAKLAAQQRDANRNSLVSKGAELERQSLTPDWKKHPHTQNKKVGRGYGVPKLSGMLQNNSRSQLTDYYMKKGMSRADAEAKASSEAQRIHDRNRADYRSGSGYD